MRQAFASACAVALLLAGCGGQQDAADGAADETGATAADTAPSDPAMLPSGKLAGQAGDNAAAAGIEQTPAAARALVDRYYALIAAGRAGDARMLWRDGGEASGMTPEAFAESFARYSSYRATVGRPGRIDAGAGQRYVEVPVMIRGTLRDGDRPFAMTGTLVLRHSIVDGATPEQREWRIAESRIRPRPDLAAADAPQDDVLALPDRMTARYTCVDGSTLIADFDNRAGTVALMRDGEALATLPQRRAASGIWYSAGDYTLRGKGDDATLSMPERPDIACRAIDE